MQSVLVTVMVFNICAVVTAAGSNVTSGVAMCKGEDACLDTDVTTLLQTRANAVLGSERHNASSRAFQVPFARFEEEIRDCVGGSPWTALRNNHEGAGFVGNFANDIKARLASPSIMNQGSESFCGPETLLYNVLSMSSEKYLQIAKDLFCTGTYRDPVGGTFLGIPLKGLHINSASKTLAEHFMGHCLYNYEKDPEIDVADWLMESSLLQTVNKINCPTAESSIFGTQLPQGKFQLTLPGEMETWANGLFKGQATITKFGSWSAEAVHWLKKLVNHVRNQAGTTPLGNFLGVHDWARILDTMDMFPTSTRTILLMDWRQRGLPAHWVTLVRVDPVPEITENFRKEELPIFQGGAGQQPYEAMMVRRMSYAGRERGSEVNFGWVLKAVNGVQVAGQDLEQVMASIRAQAHEKLVECQRLGVQVNDARCKVPLTFRRPQMRKCWLQSHGGYYWDFCPNLRMTTHFALRIELNPNAEQNSQFKALHIDDPDFPQNNAEFPLPPIQFNGRGGRVPNCVAEMPELGGDGNCGQ